MIKGTNRLKTREANVEAMQDQNQQMFVKLKSGHNQEAKKIEFICESFRNYEQAEEGQILILTDLPVYQYSPNIDETKYMQIWRIISITYNRLKIIKKI
jgi:hypothetical protein